MRRTLSGFRVALRLNRRESLPRPVALAEHGVSFRKAHQVLDRLAAGQPFAVEVVATDLARLIDTLASLGASAAIVKRPEARQVRERFGLSQADFARRFGLELRTVQNWEQARYGLDGPTRILLALIREDPEAVEAVLTSSEQPAAEATR